MVINELSQPQHQNEAQRYCHTSFLVPNIDSRGAVDLRQSIVVKHIVLYVHMVAVRYTGQRTL